jgi:hypothetical protein
VSIKSAAGYYKSKKLSELAAIIKGIKAAFSSSSNVTTTRSCLNSNTDTNDQLKRAKLSELGKMIRGEAVRIWRLRLTVRITTSIKVSRDKEVQ